MINRSILIFILYLPILLFGQTDSIYFNSNWQKCSKDTAKYLSISENINNKYYVVDYYYPSMKIQMKGSYFDKDRKIRDGIFIWYNEKAIKTDSTIYSDNHKIETYLFYNNEALASRFYYKSDKVKNATYYREDGIELFDLEKYNSEKKKYKSWSEYLEISLSSNLPLSFQNQMLSATVYLEFTVDRDGYVKNVIVLESSGNEELDNHAKQVILKSPRWSPSSKSGIAVESKMKQKLTYN